MITEQSKYGRSNKKSLSGQSASATLVYLFLFVLPSGIKFFLLPIYMKYLTPSDYGILSILNVFGSFYGVVGILQLNISAGVDYFKSSDTFRFESSILSSSIFIGLATFGIFTIAGPMVFGYLFSAVQVDFYPYGIVVLGTTLLGLIQSVFFIFLRNNYSLRELSFLSILFVLTSSVLQFFFIVYFRMGYEGSLYGSFIASLLVVSLIMVRNRELLTLNIDIDILKRGIKMSLPMILTLYLAWIQQSGDRIFLEKFLSLEKVGIYSVLMTILGACLLLNKSYSMAIRPIFFKYLQDVKSNGKKIEQLFSRFVMLSVFSVSGVVMIGSNLDLITSQTKYLEIVPYFLLGSFVILPKMLIKVPRLQLFHLSKTRLISLYSLMSTGLMVCLIPLLIQYGIKGVLIAVGTTYTIEFIFYYRSFSKSKTPHRVFSNLRLLVMTMLGMISIKYLVEYFLLSPNLFGLLQFLWVACVIAIFIDKEDLLEVKKIIIAKKI